MAAPLHKNKVIQFIERYPHDEDFTLTQGNTPLANGNTTTSFNPGCSVGLSNEAGNPSDFNALIDMWVAGGLTRNNLNPFALMRLWAATYRTYYHWCKSVTRPYSNPASSTVVTQNRLLNLNEYEVKFTSNLNSGTIEDTQLTGSFTQGKYDSGSGEYGIKRVSTAGSFKEITLAPYIPSVLFEVADVSANLLTSLPVGGIAALYGGPVKCELIFDSAVDIDAVLIPPPSNVADPALPETTNPFNWFFPSNFKIRSSYDGVNYTSSLEYNKFITALNQLVQTAVSPDKYYDWRQILYTSTSTVSYPALITAINNASNYSSSTTAKANLETWSTSLATNISTYGFINDTPFPTKVKSISYKDPSYDLSSFVVSRPLKGHEIEVVTINKSSTPKTCIVRTWFKQNGVSRYTNGTSSTLIPLQYRTNALAPLDYGYFEVIDIASGGGIICQGVCESPISMKGVRALELTSGVVDNTTLRPYLASFPYVKGTIKSIVTQLNNNLTIGNYTPTYTDAYWTTYSPESFDIGSVTFSDSIAKSAFDLLGYTGSNLNKWKLMPYTLPTSSVFLESQIKSSSATVRNVPTSFSYTEDYINNKIIPLPTSTELTQYQTDAEARGLDPVVYYFRVKFSAFLKELINYCKSTCLKFWQYSSSNRSVSNFETYTADALQFDNATLPVGDVIASGVKVYEIVTSGQFDIESNLPAGRLWFLSGGNSSRIDIDIAVLQQLLDIAGITL
ncbi:hypothetical protein [Nostoc sp. 2RC]|uniref:hypothetical protein n=1 Tax=Nostoc sp. 2RC TaxID=2485484 RepID=UPI001626C05C|nr:hypothetical protein [Nostoc sp. 2RC]MBC1235915.1 hypothetical protein [Nostoc sp. 2RC]